MGELIKPLTPHDIYVKLTSGGGTQLLDEARDAARTQWQAERERADIIRRQAELVATGWEGSASDSATGAVQPLVTNALMGATRLAMAEKLLDQQSGSFHSAANSVVPVPPVPPEPDFLDMMWPFTDYEKKVTDYQTDAQHNIAVFQGYDVISEGHEAGMGEYSTVDNSGGTISVVDSGDRIEVPDQGQPGDTSEPIDGRGDPGGGPSGGPPVGGPPAGGPPGGGGPGPLQPGQTTPSDVVPGPVGSQGPLPPGQPGSTGPTPGGFVPGLPVGGLTTGGPGGRFGPGSGGFGSPGPGSGGPGTGGPGTGGPGAGGRGPGSLRGGSFGPGMNALAAEEAAAQRAAAAAAARGGSGSGTMGGTPVGTGRGKSDEDDDHRRKVLIEADAEGLFGSDVLTAPEVIGDDEYEDD